MYDHNQTLVPDSFLALHSRQGRPLLSREEMEARHESCETLASQLAAALAQRGVGVDDADDALARVRDGLVGDGDASGADESQWVVHRIAELMDWPQPEARC
jgi:hypothetical protein